MGTVYLPVRLPRREAEILEEEAKRAGVGKSVLARMLLIKAIRELRVERAVKEYVEGKCSLGYAAQLADMSVREFLSELVRRRVPIQYAYEDLVEDLEAASHGEGQSGR